MISFSDDGSDIVFSYTILFFADERMFYEIYEGTYWELGENYGLVLAQQHIVNMMAPDIEYNIHFLDENVPCFEEPGWDELPWIGASIRKTIQSFKDVQTIVQLLDIFVQSCDALIRYSCIPADLNQLSKPVEEFAAAEVELTYADIVIIANRHKCISDEHDMENVNASLELIFPDDTRRFVLLPAYHCIVCKEYYIFEDDYGKTASSGARPVCKLILEKEYVRWRNETHGRYDDLRTESLLKLCGYNVGKKQNLSDLQRQGILNTVIEQGVMNVFHIKSHIRWLIKTRKNQPHMIDATEKWESDIQYLNREYNENGERVVVNSIRRKVYINLNDL
jgi:hypothetical protein